MSVFTHVTPTSATAEGLSWPIAHHAMTWEGWHRREGSAFDVPTMLREVVQAGYTGIEMSGDATTLGPSDALRSALQNAGLTLAAWSTHVTANPWPPNTEQYQREFDYAAEMGVRTLAVCGGFLGRQFRTTFDDDYKLFAENLDHAQRYAQANGQTVAFHPHCGCIVETQAELEQLLTHAPFLSVLIDTGHLWAVRADVPAMVRRYGRRVAHVHLKEWDAQEKRFAELGRGKPAGDLAGVASALQEIGYDGWLVVERDDPAMVPAESARVSRAAWDAACNACRAAHKTLQ